MRVSQPKYARNDTTTCDYYEHKLWSFCNASDPACCAGGLIEGAHYTYDTQYDLNATAYVKMRYERHPTVPVA